MEYSLKDLRRKLKNIKNLRIKPSVALKRIKKLYSFISGQDPHSYRYQEAFNEVEIRSNINQFEKKPLISVVMPVYEVAPKWLKKAIQSIEAQIYENWELCIADDGSNHQTLLTYLKNLKHPKIKITFLPSNQGISNASNEALKITQGEYVAFMDHDDELTRDALYQVVNEINKNDADFIYSDEDKITERGKYCEPHFKPDWSPDLFLSQNYICHLTVIKKTLINEIGGFNSEYNGAQDYDLFLRATEKAQTIVHIPKVLYHWRKTKASTASQFSHKSYANYAGQKALQACLKRRNIQGDVKLGRNPGTYHVKRTIQNNPLVSIIIPFKDKPDLLKQCLDSILDKSMYTQFEILAINNGSKLDETKTAIHHYKKVDKRIHFIDYDVPFNYSNINNHAVKQARGEHLLLLNNDVEVLSPNWIESLLECSQREEIGAVGAKLYYPNKTIQHAGVICGIGGIAGHSHKHFPKEANGYFSRLHVIQNVSAVTGACLMVKKTLYLNAKGLDENLKIAFNDVDFCLRLLKMGYRNIFTPYCELVHHESASRGYEDTPEKQARFKDEVEYLKKQHLNAILYDPFYNPNLSLIKEDFSLR